MFIKANQPIDLPTGRYRIRAIGNENYPPPDGIFDNTVWQSVEIEYEKFNYLVNPVVIQRLYFSKNISPYVLEQYKYRPNFLGLASASSNMISDVEKYKDDYLNTAWDIDKMTQSRLIALGTWFGFPYNEKEAYETWRDNFLVWIKIQKDSGLDGLLKRLQLLTNFQSVDVCEIYPAGIAFLFIGDNKTITEQQINNILPAGVKAYRGLYLVKQDTTPIGYCKQGGLTTAGQLTANAVLDNIITLTNIDYEEGLKSLATFIIDRYNMSTTNPSDYRLFIGFQDNLEEVNSNEYRSLNGIRYFFRVESPGYLDYNGSFVVTTNTTINVLLSANPVILTVTVTDSEGYSVNDFAVTIAENTHSTDTGSVDISIIPGIYEITITSPLHKTITETIQVDVAMTKNYIVHYGGVLMTYGTGAPLYGEPMGYIISGSSPSDYQYDFIQILNKE